MVQVTLRTMTRFGWPLQCEGTCYGFNQYGPIPVADVRTDWRGVQVLDLAPRQGYRIGVKWVPRVGAGLIPDRRRALYPCDSKYDLTEWQVLHAYFQVPDTPVTVLARMCMAVQPPVIGHAWRVPAPLAAFITIPTPPSPRWSGAA